MNGNFSFVHRHHYSFEHDDICEALLFRIELCYVSAQEVEKKRCPRQVHVFRLSQYPLAFLDKRPVCFDFVFEYVEESVVLAGLNRLHDTPHCGGDAFDFPVVDGDFHRFPPDDLCRFPTAFHHDIIHDEVFVGEYPVSILEQRRLKYGLLDFELAFLDGLTLNKNAVVNGSFLRRVEAHQDRISVGILYMH